MPTFLVSFDHLDSSMEGCSDANFQNVYFQVSKQISGVTGLWRCPFKLIEDVPSSLAKTYPLYRGSRFPKLTKLPPYGLNGEQLKDFVKRHSIRRGAERL